MTRKSNINRALAQAKGGILLVTVDGDLGIAPAATGPPRRPPD